MGATLLLWALSQRTWISYAMVVVEDTMYVYNRLMRHVTTVIRIIIAWITCIFDIPILCLSSYKLAR